jgi:plastocyanin
MRLVRLAPVLFLVGLVVAACSSSSGPGWTFVPEPSATPRPSTAASEAPSAVASSAASAQPSGGSGGPVVEISAAGIAFEQAKVSAPAGQAFQISFNNKDAGVPHNVKITDSNGNEVFKGDIFSGADTRTYSVPALSAGTYKFACSVHANMVGELDVQ